MIRNFALAVASGILALVIAFVCAIPLKIFQTANYGADARLGGITFVCFTVAGFVISGFIFGRRRTYGFRYSLAAVAPVVVLLSIATAASPKDLGATLSLFTYFAGIPLGAHWLFGYLGRQSATSS